MQPNFKTSRVKVNKFLLLIRTVNVYLRNYNDTVFYNKSFALLREIFGNALNYKLKSIIVINS